MLKRICSPRSAVLVGAFVAVASMGLAEAPMANASSLSQNPSKVRLTLKPEQGPPGTRVTVEGYVPGAIGVREQMAGTINFGGWPNGLSMMPNSVVWSKTEPGHFVTHFAVPTTAWLSLRGEVHLKDGPETVGIQCFGPMVEGCGLRPDQAAAVFDVTGVRAQNNPTPTLTVHPASGQPGQAVTLSGWAPLTEEFGRSPFGYQVVWQSDGKSTAYGEIGSLRQSVSGELYGTIQIPAQASPLGTLLGQGHLALEYVFTDLGANQLRRAATVTLDSTRFEITRPPQWSTLIRHASLTELSSNQSRGYFNSLAALGQRVFAASGGRLWMSDTGGQSWTALPTGSLHATIRAMGYVPFNQANLTGLILAPGSATHLFASIPAEIAKKGAPPIDEVGVYSPNAGKTWKPVPVPQGMMRSDFGGFQAEGHAVWAWWQSAKGVMMVEASTDGGSEWHPLNPRRVSPKRLWLGPVPASNYGQMSTQTEPLVQANAHGIWKALQSAVINMGTITQLATLSNHAILWLGNISYPVQISTNDGRTFTDVATPAVPGTEDVSTLPLVRLLPTKALLAQDPQNGKYYELNPGSQAWTLVPASDTLANAAITVSQGRVYWIRQSISGPSTNTPPHVLSVPLSCY